MRSHPDELDDVDYARCPCCGSIYPLVVGGEDGAHNAGCAARPLDDAEIERLAAIALADEAAQVVDLTEDPASSRQILTGVSDQMGPKMLGTCQAFSATDGVQ